MKIHYFQRYHTKENFFVERFYPMDFKKVTPRPPMGSRIFNLSEILGTEKLPETEQIAELLSNKTWE